MKTICPKCGGKGVEELPIGVVKPNEPGKVVERPCEHCHGSGYIGEDPPAVVMPNTAGYYFAQWTFGDERFVVEVREGGEQLYVTRMFDSDVYKLEQFTNWKGPIKE